MNTSSRSKLGRVARYTIVALATALIAPAAAQQRESTPLATESAQAVVQHMDSNPQLRDLFAACPADNFRRARAQEASGALRTSGSEARCAADPSACYAACLSGSGSACFSLARAFQENEATVPPRYTQTLFATSCGFGYAAGCTNRASSIRNSLRDGDPFRNASKRVRDACQFRSFRIACRGNDAWGCAMLGQSYQYGEGVGVSAPLARGAFRKSCSLAPGFEACSFSREGMSELARPRQR